MTTPQVTVKDQVTYTAPGGPSNGASILTSVSANYDTIAAGTIEIPAATAAATRYVIPFVGITVDARVLKISNRATNTNSIGVRLNAASADVIDLAPGGSLCISNPTDPTVGLTAASFGTVGVQGAAPAYIDYFVYGT